MAENNNHIHSNFSHSEYSVAELINVFQLCSDRINTLHENASKDFKALGIATRNHYKEISAIHQTAAEIEVVTGQHSALLFKEAKESLTYISNITTLLQFDDIVRQKLEHIQQAIAEIIQELNNTQQATDNKESQPIKYLCILCEITKLHLAQLAQTNQDYQRAFTSIKTNLKAIQQSSSIIINRIDFLKNQCDFAAFEIKLKNISRLAEQLAAQINSSLKKTKYCETFAYEVEEIAKHMQKISSGQVIGIINENQKDILIELEKMYTMESERTIHHKVLDIEAHPNKIHMAEEAIDSPDDTVELF